MGTMATGLPTIINFIESQYIFSSQQDESIAGKNASPDFSLLHMLRLLLPLRMSQLRYWWTGSTIWLDLRACNVPSTMPPTAAPKT